jgi:hypothetical protein
MGRPVPLCDVEDALVRSLERVFESPVQEITTTELGLGIDAYRRPDTVCI